jgi:Ca2+:H+ antiporter
MKPSAAMSAVGSAAAIVIPLVAVAVLCLEWGRALSDGFVAFGAVLLAACIVTAVHHARVVAQQVGTRSGSFALAVAVTLIVVALIATMMIAGPDGAQTIARDTVFAIVMISCNGILGLSMLVAVRRAPSVSFDAEGPSAGFAAVATLSALTLVLPSFMGSPPGLQFSPWQLAFVAVVALVLYGLFVTLQPPESTPTRGQLSSDKMGTPPTTSRAATSLVLLLLTLVAVIGNAKLVLPAVGTSLLAAGLPISVLGAAIAVLVLLPAVITAIRAAQCHRVQVSLNLAFGSTMASIGLSIFAIAIASIWLPVPLRLGLTPAQMVLLGLTFLVTMVTVVSRRATFAQATLHLLLLAAYPFYAFNSSG